MVDTCCVLYARLSAFSICCAVTPSAAALSRSISRFTCGFFISRSVFTSWSCGKARSFASRAGAALYNSLSVRALERILVLALRKHAADADWGQVLHEYSDADHARGFCAQFLDDLIGGEFALRPRFQPHEDPAGVGGRVRAARTDARHEGLDIRVLGDDIGNLLLMFFHIFKGDSLLGLGNGEDLAGVLGREKAFRYDKKKRERHGNKQKRNHQRNKAVS